MVTSVGWSYRGWEHYRQLTTACNPSSSSGLHRHNTYKYIHRYHIIYMYIYICMYTHTKKQESDGETDKNKNGGEKSDTTSDNQGECLALLELQNAEKTENTSHC